MFVGSIIMHQVFVFLVHQVFVNLLGNLGQAMMQSFLAPSSAETVASG